jgi:cytochrome c556
MNRAALALLLPLAACASATAAPAPTATGPTPAEIVAARQAAFNLLAGTFGGMKGTVESGGEVKGLGFGARGIARWGKAIPSMFPAGTALPSSRAKPEIWTNRADFEAKAAALAEAGARLAEIAGTGDKEAFAAQYKAVGQACAACHDTYRAEAAH